MCGRAGTWAGLVALVLLAGAGPGAGADGPAERAPGTKGKGKRFQWKSADGLVYEYRVPESYDPKRGAGLTLVLHGSNLDRRWGFANHSVKTFRPDDIVVCPDGTTPNGRGGFNFLGERKDAKRLHALLGELQQAFEITGVYLYGHSQGSFFALYYAGEYPKDVNGVVAHASGVWTWTKLGRKGHHQAIVLMHGTQDPVVPYGQSVGGYEAIRKAKYPLVRLRSLEGWNHWPAEHNLNRYRQAVPHTSQQLAWVEGMTTEDPERLDRCFSFLADDRYRERHDYAGTWSLARRAADFETAPAKTRARAAKVAVAVGALAQAHAEAIEKQRPKTLALDGEAWLVHLLMFLRAFEGVPACETLREQTARGRERSAKAGLAALRAYWKAKNGGDGAEAFDHGVDAIRDGFCFHEVWGREFLGGMAELRGRAKALGLPRRSQKTYDQWRARLDAARKAGEKAFDGLNKRRGKLP